MCQHAPCHIDRVLVWVYQLGTWGTTTRRQVPEAALSASRDQVAEKGFRNNIPRGRASQGQKPAGQQQRRAQPTTREGQPSTPCAHQGGRETRQPLALKRGRRRPQPEAGVCRSAPCPLGLGSCRRSRRTVMYSVRCAGSANSVRVVPRTSVGYPGYPAIDLASPGFNFEYRYASKRAQTCSTLRWALFMDMICCRPCPHLVVLSIAGRESLDFE